ncbi:hypothetical protein FA15DRAFT_659694 [Coprinopsis marcescibilis]|uniref:Uncharacterized protein n=1 Tax=Coprinopsis marcescibilis TaxID=230819 RepID=A0A5C3KIP3_COPMA|nr:hypothetical protein FA15DRAFT_659694 [Coprinopsis marcescibilis]
MDRLRVNGALEATHESETAAYAPRWPAGGGKTCIQREARETFRHNDRPTTVRNCPGFQPLVEKASDTERTVGCLVHAQKSTHGEQFRDTIVSPSWLDDLFRFSSGTTATVLRDLHSVVFVPTAAEHQKLSLLFRYKSLEDFFLSKERGGAFYYPLSQNYLQILSPCKPRQTLSFAAHGYPEIATQLASRDADALFGIEGIPTVPQSVFKYLLLEVKFSNLEMYSRQLLTLDHTLNSAKCIRAVRAISVLKSTSESLVRAYELIAQHERLFLEPLEGEEACVDQAAKSRDYLCQSGGTFVPNIVGKGDDI